MVSKHFPSSSSCLLSVVSVQMGRDKNVLSNAIAFAFEVSIYLSLVGKAQRAVPTKRAGRVSHKEKAERHEVLTARSYQQQFLFHGCCNLLLTDETDDLTILR